MNWESFQWVIAIILLPLIWKMWDTLRSINKDLWESLNKHKEDTNKMFVDIIQNAIPTAMKDVKDDIKEIKVLVMRILENRK